MRKVKNVPQSVRIRGIVLTDYGRYLVPVDYDPENKKIVLLVLTDDDPLIDIGLQMEQKMIWSVNKMFVTVASYGKLGDIKWIIFDQPVCG